MCVSPTFASPIEKPTTSTRRRICREIIGNTEGNAKTEDSLRHCKWANSTSKSAPKTKKPTGGPVGGESRKWSGRLDSNQRPLRPERSAPTRLSYAPIFMSLFQAEFLPGIQWECNLSAFSKMSSRNLSFSVKSFLPDPPPSSIFVPGTPFCNSFLFRLLDASIRENERHPSVMASAIALSSFPRNLFP